MSNKHLALVIALCIVSALANRNTTAHEPGEGGDACVCDSRGHLLSDGFGNCVKTGAWKLPSKGLKPAKITADTDRPG